MRHQPDVFLAFLAALTLATAANRLCGDAVDDAVAAQMAKYHIPGVSLAIIQDGKIVKAKGYGVTDLATRSPVTADTLFQAGSVSKPVAALGALALVEAGKLSLDGNINGALKSWHLPENDFTKDHPVTLRLLLSHRAGTTVHGFPGYEAGAPVPTLRQVLDGEKPANTPAIRVDVVPGSKTRYSGGGYVIVQQAVEDVAGEPFPAYMRRRVLEPLHMDASTFEQPLPAGRQPLAATGYFPNGQAVPGRFHVYPEMAPAGLWTTPTDLCRFAIAVQQSLAGGASPVITPAMTREMLTAQGGPYGLGLAVSGHGVSRRFAHGGRDEGFDTAMTAYAETGQGAVVMINANENSPAVARIFDAIADAYGWPDYPHHRPSPAIEDKEPAVTAQVKTIFQQAQRGEFDRALYSPELAKLLDEALRPDGPARKTLEGYGTLQSIALTGRRDDKGTRSYQYRIVFERETIQANCVYDPQGTIVGLWFAPE